MKYLVRSGLVFLALLILSASQPLMSAVNRSSIPLMADDPKIGSGTGG